MFEAKFQTFTETSDKTRSAERVAALRAELTRLGVQGFLVPLADEHQSEYVPPSEQRLAWLTAFTGSAGLAIILEEKAAVLIDGRYTAQVEEQVDHALFERVANFKVTPAQWLCANAPAGAAIGYDDRLSTAPEIERLAKSVERQGLSLRAIENPIDRIWKDRPAQPLASVSLHAAKYAGVETAEKLRELRAALAREGVDGLLVSDPHASAWLFNIRGADVEHTPLPLCYSFVPKEGAATLFIDGRKLSNSVRDALASQMLLAEPREMDGQLAAFAKGKTIRIDAASAGIRFKTLVENAGGVADVGTDPIALMKAKKNRVEIAGARTAHLRDGAAMARFLAWFDAEAPKGKLSEIDAVVALETFRRETKALKEISFNTIAGAGPNAAMPHYRVSEASNRRITKGIFLIDSGAQYQDGTTDITRTLAVGSPTAEMKDRFTRVLKGMIAISRVQFPKGVSGAQIDAFARAALWEAGLDYDHGTGHGIGSFLSVHEGPQRIAKTGVTTLEAGMMLSNEPGYYKPGHYGIRIENLIVVEPREIAGAEREMLGFETLTFSPIDRRLIDKGLLTADERAWLNAYHEQTLAKIGPLVDAPTRDWLTAACKAV